MLILLRWAPRLWRYAMVLFGGALHDASSFIGADLPAKHCSAVHAEHCCKSVAVQPPCDGAHYRNAVILLIGSPFFRSWNSEVQMKTEPAAWVAANSAAAR